MVSRVDRLLATLRQRGELPALAWADREVAAGELALEAEEWRSRLAGEGLEAGTALGLRGDYSPMAIAAMLGALRLGLIVVPFTRGATVEIDALSVLGRVARMLEVHPDDSATLGPQRTTEPNELLETFRGLEHAGVIVFSSGSTGRPKAILHDAERLLAKFDRSRTALRTLQFLLMDHLGGINTLFAVLSYGGVVVAPIDRSPGAIARLIERDRVELLPVTPTFLNLFLASGVAAQHDLSSVSVITYGTEVMPDPTLQRLRETFPNARLQQTYGLSELGVLRSRSKDDASLWMKVGGEGFETKIEGGTLHVRSEYAMVGYLNAPDPFDADGWMDTGDVVERDGEWLRVRGRHSDLINVGGQKVFPAEVEEVLLAAPNVEDATAFGEPHPLMGQVVVADVALSEDEDVDALRQRLRAFCRARLAPYKVPVRFRVMAAPRHTARFKKARS